MNKAELIAAVAEKSGLSRKDSEKAVNAAFDTITESLVNGDKVSLVGFGARSALPASAATPRPRKRSPSPLPALLPSRSARPSRTLSPASKRSQFGSPAHIKKHRRALRGGDFLYGLIRKKT